MMEGVAPFIWVHFADASPVTEAFLGSPIGRSRTTYGRRPSYRRTTVARLCNFLHSGRGTWEWPPRRVVLGGVIQEGTEEPVIQHGAA
jgi:hypothetical protein